MNDMVSQMVSDIFRTLSHPIRLKIVELLKERPLCVCDILPQLDSTPSNTSQHLLALKNKGIIDKQKDGLMMIYSIKSPEVYQMIEICMTILSRQIDETKFSLKK